ncbi:MAG: hypothetical protein ACM3ML_38920 [Micromonosporaceae bacterium]
MSTFVYGDLSVEIREDVGNRLDQAMPGVSPPGFAPRVPRAAVALPDVLGRGEQLSDLRDAIMTHRPIEVYASCGYGKSTLLRYVAAGGLEPRAPYVFLRVGNDGAQDISQRLFAAMYTADRPAIPTPEQRAHYLGRARAVVVLDDVLAGSEHVEYLLRMLPGCCLVLGAPRPVLGRHGRSLALPGLSDAAAADLLARDLGRPLQSGEQPTVTRLVAAVDGQPLHLRQAASLVRSGEQSFASLAGKAERDAGVLDLLSINALAESDRRALAVLALAAGAFLPAQLVGAMGDVAQIGDCLASLRRRGLADQHGDRFGLPICKVDSYRQTLLSDLGVAAATRELINWLFARDPGSEESLSAVGAALNIIGFAAERQDWETVISLVRLAEPVLTLAGRWQACQEILHQGLKAAKAVGDSVSEAFFSHQQGTLDLCRGDADSAQPSLEHALDLRERLGDDRGAEATRHNLGLFVAPRPRPAPRPRHPKPRTFVSAAALALAVIGAAAGVVKGLVPGHPQKASNRAGTPTSTVTTTPTITSPTTGPIVIVPPADPSASHSTAGHSVPPASTSGSPTPAAPPSPSPGQFDFGPVDLSPNAQPPMGPIALTNPNDRAVTIAGITTTGDPGFGIARNTCADQTLEPHTACAAYVTFKPRGLGIAIGTLVVTTGAGASASVPLEGTGFLSLNITMKFGPKTASMPVTVKDLEKQGQIVTCYSSCAVRITSPDLTMLTLVATAQIRERVVLVPTAWSGDCLTSTSPANCPLKLTRDLDVMAQFP